MSLGAYESFSEFACVWPYGRPENVPEKALSAPSLQWLHFSGLLFYFAFASENKITKNLERGKQNKQTNRQATHIKHIHKMQSRHEITFEFTRWQHGVRNQH